MPLFLSCVASGKPSNLSELPFPICVVGRGLSRLQPLPPSLFISTPPLWLLWPLGSSQIDQLSFLPMASHMLFPMPKHPSSREPRVFLPPPHPLSLCSSNITLLERLLLILLAKPPPAIIIKKSSTGKVVSGMVTALCGDRWHDTCGEHNGTYRHVESLGHAPETHVTSCVHYTSIKKKKEKKKESHAPPPCVSPPPQAPYFSPPARSPASLPSPCWRTQATRSQSLCFLPCCFSSRGM